MKSCANDIVPNQTIPRALCQFWPPPHSIKEIASPTTDPHSVKILSYKERLKKIGLSV